MWPVRNDAAFWEFAGGFRCDGTGRAISTGPVTDMDAVGADYVIRNGDLVSHTSHRHEPPVTAEPIAVIHEDNDYLIVNKPAGVPVHPAGRYNFNSVVEILKSERGAHFMPRPCHRLDRLTSGILCFGKTAQAATDLSRQIQARMVRKEYVARVIGHFPDGEVVCDQPLLQISPRLGLNRVRANGKFARTVFKRLAYYPPASSDVDGGPEQRPKTPEEAADEEQRPWTSKKGYSIVRCLPLTGRTHQIRVHLQFLGYPIQNDPIYANQRVWGFDLGCNDDGTTHTDEDIMSRLEKMGKEEVADAVAYHEEMVDLYHKRRAEKLSGELCKTCDTPLYTDPGDQELSLFLHSLRYEDSGAPTCAADQWIISFTHDCRRLAQTKNIDALLRPSRVNLKTLLEYNPPSPTHPAPRIHIADLERALDVNSAGSGAAPHPLAELITALVDKAGTANVVERLALFLPVQRVVAWLAQPTRESYNALVLNYAPRPSQLTVPHPQWVDFVLQGPLRDAIIERQDVYATEEFQNIYANSLRLLNWPGRPVDAINMDPTTGEVWLNDTFAAHALRIENWRMHETFVRRYPELRGFVELTES
ncbi:hypothetical protein BN1723_004232 [Verticillium longisporum]|uniref:Pseudouridine synthase RsuA/RluA-like domain-containing protein n=1 Tax=Verticillium longisporum TaxID=100787 RepID=A0A0G4MQL7_VERLO|nr:hypothetical protein BN1723_004232 [Verticillium longisporum]